MLHSRITSDEDISGSEESATSNPKQNSTADSSIARNKGGRAYRKQRKSTGPKSWHPTQSATAAIEGDEEGLIPGFPIRISLLLYFDIYFDIAANYIASR